MNRLFQAWTQTACHQAIHSETGQAPAARREKASPQERAVPEPALLREAFLRSERRRAGKTALVRMHGNLCQAGAWLAGQYVELVFDPLSRPCDNGSYADLSVIPIFTFPGRRGLPEVGIMQAAVISVPGQ